MIVAIFFAPAASAAATHAIAGAPRSALLMNFEPVATVLLASLVLGETLSGLQGLGAALIVGAIVVTALARLRARGR